jgi:hypothetical protein
MATGSRREAPAQHPSRAAAERAASAQGRREVAGPYPGEARPATCCDLREPPRWISDCARGSSAVCKSSSGDRPPCCPIPAPNLLQGPGSGWPSIGSLRPTGWARLHLQAWPSSSLTPLPSRQQPGSDAGARDRDGEEKSVRRDFFERPDLSGSSNAYMLRLYGMT